MIEDKLDGSSNFKFLEDKTSEEDLLWVIQKGLPETTINEEKEKRKEDDIKARKIIIYSCQLQNIKMTKGDTVAIFFMKMSEIRDQLGAIGEFISTLLGMHLYILFVSLS